MARVSSSVAKDGSIKVAGASLVRRDASDIGRTRAKMAAKDTGKMQDRKDMGIEDVVVSAITWGTKHTNAHKGSMV